MVVVALDCGAEAATLERGADTLGSGAATLGDAASTLGSGAAALGSGTGSAGGRTDVVVLTMAVGVSWPGVKMALMLSMASSCACVLSGVM